MLTKLFLLALCFFSAGAQNAKDRAVLIDIYNSAGGANWTKKWNFTAATVCGNMVACGLDGTVRTLSLSTNNLNGTVPTTIGLLSSLTALSISYNALSGPIPTEICNLTKLTTLALNYCSFTGSIPTCLERLVNLKSILLEYNQLSGSIPTQVSNHPSAAELRLTSNKITGDLPTVWSSKLVSIFLDGNKITGSIPTQIFTASLSRLRLSSNKLTGSIPATVSSTLTEYYIFSNQLDGTIPSSLADNDKMTRLWAYQNSLTGTLPSSFGAAKALFDMRLMTNKLSGSIPPALGDSKLRYIWLHENSLTGQIPSELGSLGTLNSLRLGGNLITGNIPGPLLRNGALTDVALSNTCLGPVEIYDQFATNDYASFLPNNNCAPGGPFELDVINYSPLCSYRFGSASPLADSSANQIDLVLYDPGFFDQTNYYGQAGNPMNTALFSRSFSTYGLRSSQRLAIFGDFSVELLISSNLGSVNSLFAFASGSIETGQLLSLELSQSGVLTLLDDDLAPLITSPVVIHQDQTHYIAVTWSPELQSLALFVDGVLQGTQSIPLSLPLNGFYYFYLGNSWTATFDQVSVLGVELKQADIQQRISLLDWCPALSCLGTCSPSETGATCI